jgi:AcrR family transcriptional regulator
MMDAESEDRSTRERILASAERLFAERAFDRTSTARIADDANVPHGLIFYYFKTKMDLLLAATEGYASAVIAELELPTPDGGDLCYAVSDLWDRLATVLGHPNAVSRILFQELSVHPAASGHDGARLPEHDAAARLLAITAAIAPLLGEPGHSPMVPESVATVITQGIAGRIS